MVRKLLSVGLVAALVVSLLMVSSPASATDYVDLASKDSNFNPTGYPIVKEKVEKTIIIRRPPNIADPNEMAVFKYIEELTNVKINWVVLSSDGWGDRINLIMASSDLPDAVIKGGPNITRASEDGSIIDMRPLMDAYAPGLKSLFAEYPAIVTAITSPDGGIYQLPGVNTLKPNRTSHRNLWINKVWLEKLNLDMPTTTDEFIEVLKQFRDGDPNGNGIKDEIPYVVEDSGGSRTGRPDIFASFFGLYSNMGYENMRVVDGKASFLKIDPAWKEVLQFMNTLWQEDLLDHEVFTQSPDASLAKFSNGNSGVFGLSSDDLFSTVSDQYTALPPVRASSDVEPVIGLAPVAGGGAGVITKADKSPWVTMRWLDIFYTLEGSKIIGGLAPELEGVTCVKLDDGTYEYADHILNDPRGTAVAVGEMCPLPGGGFGYWRNEFNSNYIYSRFVRENVPQYERFYQKDAAYGMPTFSLEDAEIVNDIRRDLDVYVLECQSKFITGEMSFDQWDNYVETVKRMGVDTLVEQFQKALDAQ